MTQKVHRKGPQIWVSLKTFLNEVKFVLGTLWQPFFQGNNIFNNRNLFKIKIKLILPFHKLENQGFKKISKSSLL